MTENKYIMEKVVIESADDKPSILIDPEQNLIKITGASYPENAIPTYSKVIKWIKENSSNFSGEWICEFYFTYVNSASKKSVFEMLLLLDALQKEGKNIKVVWNCDQSDDDMIEMGNEFLGMTSMKYLIKLH